MSNLTQEDFDLLYWHALQKMRSGQFRGAHQFFRYIFESKPNFMVGLAMSYCAIREGDLEQARYDLAQIKPQNLREERLYTRLAKRVGMVAV